MEAGQKPNGAMVKKIDAGSRQLDEAIRMFFEERDTVAVHTLAAAASEVLHDLAKAEGIPTLKDRVSAKLTTDGTKTLNEVVRKAQNFFKHADRSGQHRDSTVEFSPEETEFVLFDAVMAANALGVLNSAERGIYTVWFMLKYPGVIDQDSTPATLIENATKLGIDPSDRSAFREIIRRRSK